jgi:hypothetical protein
VTFNVVFPEGIVNVEDDVTTVIAEKPPAGVAQVGDAADPAEVKTCPAVPKEGEAPTPTARDEFSVKPVLPAA